MDVNTCVQTVTKSSLTQYSDMELVTPQKIIMLRLPTATNDDELLRIAKLFIQDYYANFTPLAPAVSGVKLNIHGSRHHEKRHQHNVSCACMSRYDLCMPDKSSSVRELLESRDPLEAI